MNILIKYDSWPVIIWCYCVYTESQYVSARHTEENGYMFLTFFHPSTACLRVMSRVYSSFIFFVFYSFRLTEN